MKIAIFATEQVKLKTIVSVLPMNQMNVCGAWDDVWDSWYDNEEQFYNEDLEEEE